MFIHEGTAGEMPHFELHDSDQHYYTADQWPLSRDLYELDEIKQELTIHDPMWGEEVIGGQEGDAVLMELFKHPVFQRLAAIEQLTLPQIYATMPGTFDFTRWEHVWGSVVFVRKMLREAEENGRQFSPKEKNAYQLRALLSDAGHTAFSHLGDWLKQTFGGTEDSHDLTLPDFLEQTGVNAILRKYDINPAEVTMPEGAADFAERSSPWLCTDRVDYGCREITRWIDIRSQDMWRNAFYIDDDNQLIMQNKGVADYFTLAFGIMSTEHHLQPVHRLQLQLFAELVKGALLNGVSHFGYTAIHPYDALHTIDSDIMTNVRQVSGLNHNLHAIMLDIARAQRRAFDWGRKESISQFLRPFKPAWDGGPSVFPQDHDQQYPHPLTKDSWDDEYSGNCPPTVEIIPVSNCEDVADFNNLPHTLDVFLPALKPRWVDPPYKAEDGAIKRVSDDLHMRCLMDEQATVQKQAYVARIYLAPEAASRLKRELRSMNALWETAVARPRTLESIHVLQGNLTALGRLALNASPNNIRHIPLPGQGPR